MPIEVTCPSCQATLPIPENFTGKKVRCSDCEGIVEVPAALSPAAKAKAARKPEIDDEERPSKRRRAADDDDEQDVPRRRSKRSREDDEDEEYNRPRGGGNTGVPKVWLVLAGVVGIAIIVGLRAALMPGPHGAPLGVPAPIFAPIANPPFVVANPAPNGPMNNFAPVIGQQNDVPIDGWEHEVVPNQPKK